MSYRRFITLVATVPFGYSVLVKAQRFGGSCADGSKFVHGTVRVARNGFVIPGPTNNSNRTPRE